MGRETQKESVKKTAKTNKNRFVFMVFSLLLGGLTGAISWLFLKVMDVSLVFFWETLPARVNIPWYPVAACAAGGLVIGVCQKWIGDYPQSLEHVMSEIKETGRCEYKKTPGIALCALLPLVFGGSVGPEAGLAGIIAGLCVWVGERFKRVAYEMRELAEIGMSATLGTIFGAPLFGFMAPIESVNDTAELPKAAKTVLYFTAILGGLGSFALLTGLFGGGMTIGRFEECTIGRAELLWFIPLAFAGVLAGRLYSFAEKAAGLFGAGLERFTILRSVAGGILLGLLGVFLPLTMFAGETQMLEVMDGWRVIPPAVLILTGFSKIIITNVCLKTGWKGGNIFPIIFSGVCIGFAAAKILGTDGAFSVMAVTAALCGCVMRKPLTVTLLLLICFPIKGIIAVIAAAFIGAALAGTTGETA